MFYATRVAPLKGPWRGGTLKDIIGYSVENRFESEIIISSVA